MKVVMQIRKDVQKYPGGDFVQLLKTKEYLEKLGIRVSISFSHKENLKDYQLVHLFNVTRITDTYLYFKNAISQRKKIVISPIYHSLRDMEDFYKYYYKLPFFNIDLYFSLKEIYYAIRTKSAISLKSINNHKGSVAEVLGGAEMLLPNSTLELDSIKAELDISEKKFKIIPNATEIDIVRLKGFEKKNLILCIGRIEPLKNQLGVIDAFLRLRERFPLDTKLLFVGALNRGHRNYCKKVLKKINESGPSLEYIGQRSHPEVLDLCAKARLLVLASFFETTGLVGLEALANSTNVVITERGYTKEYYKKAAFYCDPYSTDSLAEAMVAGFHDNFRYNEAADVIKKCTWESAAKLTFEAYEEVLRT